MVAAVNSVSWVQWIPGDTPVQMKVLEEYVHVYTIVMVVIKTYECMSAANGLAFPLIAQIYRILHFHYLKVCVGVVSKIPYVVSRIESAFA